MLFKKTILMTTLCLMTQFYAPASSAQDTAANQNTSNTHLTDPSMNTNTGATTDSTTGSISDTGQSANSMADNPANSATGNANSVADSAQNSADRAADRTADTAQGVTSDTTVGSMSDESRYTEPGRTADPAIQAEEVPGRSPFFYIAIALLAFVLIGYAVKASKRNNPHHTHRNT